MHALAHFCAVHLHLVELFIFISPPGRDVSSRVQLTRGGKAELEFEFEFEFGNSNSNSNSTSANRTNSNSHELELEKLEEKCW